MSFDLPLTDVVVPEDDVEAVLDVYRAGWLTMGPRTLAFEEAFAEVVGVEHAVAVSSGTAALHLALLAAGVGPGDEVLLPALAFGAAAAAVRACGGVPVPCESRGPDDLNVDASDVERRITPRSRVILATHWWGYGADVEALAGLADAHGLTLLEDAAHAVLAELDPGTGGLAGSAGLAGCFSFSSKRQLCVGEGGMVVTRDPETAARVRSLRSHAMTSVTWDRHRGHAESYDVVDFGFNHRMDEPRAALGLSRLPRLRTDVERRRSMVRAYRAALDGRPGVVVPWTEEAVERSSHFAFGVLLDDEGTRDRVRTALTRDGIETTAYPCGSPSTDDAAPGSLPVSEELARRHVALPLSSTYGEPEVDRVVAALDAALDAQR